MVFFCKEDRARCLPVASSDRARGNRHELKHEQFLLNMRRYCFTVRMTEHSNRLPRELVEPLSLGTFKSPLDRVLGNLFYRNMLEHEPWTW